MFERLAGTTLRNVRPVPKPFRIEVGTISRSPLKTRENISAGQVVRKKRFVELWVVRFPFGNPREEVAHAGQARFFGASRAHPVEASATTLECGRHFCAIPGEPRTPAPGQTLCGARNRVRWRGEGPRPVRYVLWAGGSATALPPSRRCHRSERSSCRGSS